MDKIKLACFNYLDCIESNDERTDAEIDNQVQLIFEAAMEAVYGEDIWDRVNTALSGGVKYYDGD